MHSGRNLTLTGFAQGVMQGLSDALVFPLIVRDVLLSRLLGPVFISPSFVVVLTWVCSMGLPFGSKRWRYHHNGSIATAHSPPGSLSLAAQ